MSFKGFDLSAKKRQIQSNIKKLASRTKKPKKETLEVINSILDDILREVEGEELELEEKKEEILKTSTLFMHRVTHRHPLGFDHLPP